MTSRCAPEEDAGRHVEEPRADEAEELLRPAAEGDERVGDRAVHVRVIDAVDTERTAALRRRHAGGQTRWLSHGQHNNQGLR